MSEVRQELVLWQAYCEKKMALEDAQDEIKKLRSALRRIEYLDRPQVRGLPRRKTIQEIALGALGKNNERESRKPASSNSVYGKAEEASENIFDEACSKVRDK